MGVSKTRYVSAVLISYNAFVQIWENGIQTGLRQGSEFSRSLLCFYASLWFDDVHIKNAGGIDGNLVKQKEKIYV